MARRKKRNRSAQRDVSPIANFVAARPIRSAGLSLSPDLRTWLPDPVAAVFQSNRSATRLQESQPNVNKRSSGGRSRGGVPKLHFAVPERVGVCVRRKQRREVLLALRLGKKGSRGRRRRNPWSGVSCK